LARQVLLFAPVAEVQLAGYQRFEMWRLAGVQPVACGARFELGIADGSGHFGTSFIRW
jgi:hypothetical protein